MSLLNLDPNSVVNADQQEGTSTVNYKPMLVKAGVPSFYYRKRKNQSYAELPKLRILPCFDFSTYQTEQFKSTWVPFKSTTLNGGSHYTQWAVPVKGYIFFGSLWEHFLSPATLQPVDQKYPTKHTDPIADLRTFIFFANRENKTMYDGITPLVTPEEVALIEYPKEADKFQVLPNKPRVFLMMNALLENQESGEWEQKVVIVSGQTFQAMTESFDTKPGRSDPIINSNFEDNLFGDPTDPTSGCVIFPRKCKSTTGLEMLGLAPSPDGKTLSGHKIMPISADHLQNRYLLNDPDNVLDIWSYQQILDQLCKDPAIPLELLEKAYDNHAFSPDATLHLDLREEGLEILKQREENKNKIAEQASTSASTPKPATFSIPQTNVTPVEPKIINVQVDTSPSITNVEPVEIPQEPTSSGLTPEEEQEFQELSKMAASNAMAAPGNLERYMVLINKRHGVGA